MGNFLKNIGVTVLIGFINGVYGAAKLAIDVVQAMASYITDVGDPYATKISWKDYRAPRTNDNVTYHYRHDYYLTTIAGSTETNSSTIGLYYETVWPR